MDILHLVDRLEELLNQSRALWIRLFCNGSFRDYVPDALISSKGLFFQSNVFAPACFIFPEPPGRCSNTPNILNTSIPMKKPRAAPIKLQ